MTTADAHALQFTPIGGGSALDGTVRPVLARTELVDNLLSRLAPGGSCRDEDPYRDLQTFTVAAVMAGWVVPRRLTERVLADLVAEARE